MVNGDDILRGYCLGCHFLREDIQDHEINSLKHASLGCLCGSKYISIRVLTVYDDRQSLFDAKLSVM